MNESYFHDNIATLVGGAIDNNATATITNSTLSYNTAGNNGGAIWTDGTLTLTNVTITGNKAANFGGGVRVTSGTANITNSTIVNNEADTDGSGFETGGGISNDGGTLTLNNTVVAGNVQNNGTQKSDVAGAATGQFNFIGVDTDLTGITDGTAGNRVGTNGTPLDPKLNPLAFNGGPTPTHLPAAGSPLIGTGAPAALAGATDQRGNARPDTGTTVGSVELVVPQQAPDQNVPEQPDAATHLFAVGSGAGTPGTVKVYNADGSLRFNLTPFGGFAGGVRVATGDVTAWTTSSLVPVQARRAATSRCLTASAARRSAASSRLKALPAE